MAWKDLGSRIRWDNPKTVEGVYKGRKSVTTDMGENFLYTLEVDGEPQAFFGTIALNDQLQHIDPETKVRIEYIGTKRVEKGTAKLFKVAVWEEDLQ